MTTPERIRARQHILGAIVAALGAFTVLSAFYFSGRDAAITRCIEDYNIKQSQVSALRADLLERESRVTRAIINDALSARTRAQIQTAKRQYDRALAEIDAARERNPVPTYNGTCQ